LITTKVSFHDIETRLFKDGEIFKVATAGPGGKPGVFTIAYTFGHYPLQQYLIDTGKGHLQALNIAWDKSHRRQRRAALVPPAGRRNHRSRAPFILDRPFSKCK